MNMILHPGEYFIELEFDRPVDPAVLHRALTSMGFGVVVFDQSLASVEVGALSLGRVKVSSKAPAITPVQSRYSPSAPVVPLANLKPTTPPVVSRTPASSVVASVISAKLADGGTPAALKSTLAKAATYASKPAFVRPASAEANPAETMNPTASPAFPGDVPVEPKGEFKAPSYSSEEAGPALSPEPEQASPPPSPPSPEPQAASPSPEPQAPSLKKLEVERDPKKLTELWTKWKEWGSPFASGPSVSGAGEGDDDPLRFRVLARLDRPIALDDRPGMRWLFVKALSIPFLSDLLFQAHPHTLRQGALYELRFLSRAKSNRTRDSVKQELVDMGWKPVKLSAIKRNMTLPRRPASLTLWYGMAVWNHADSVIVNDDPFFFETVKEIRPQ